MYINWDLAPEGTDKLMQDLNEIYWGNAKGEWFDTDDMTWNKPLSKNHVTIAIRPQPERKTVEDAVEFYNSVWPSLSNKIDKIKFDMGDTSSSLILVSRTLKGFM